VILLLAGLASFMGCKENPVVGEIAAIADKVCACKDFKCAEGVQQEAIEYSKKHRSTMVSKEDNRAVAASMAKAKGCLDALAPKKAEPPKAPADGVAPAEAAAPTQAAAPTEAAPSVAAPPAAEPAPAALEARPADGGLEARPAEDETPSR
jgi:hypothetical protein